MLYWECSKTRDIDLRTGLSLLVIGDKRGILIATGTGIYNGCIVHEKIARVRYIQASDRVSPPLPFRIHQKKI